MWVCVYRIASSDFRDVTTNSGWSRAEIEVRVETSKVLDDFKSTYNTSVTWISEEGTYSIRHDF